MNDRHQSKIETTMQIVYTLEEPKVIEVPPVVLSIGNFDGVHLGHQSVLKRVVEVAKNQKTASAVITFLNHPSEVLNPAFPTPLLCTKEHKLKLLEIAGIEKVHMIPFTKEFSEQSADFFLRRLQQSLPFHTLIFGNDVHIGKNREGDRQMLSALSNELRFDVEYFPECTKDGERISSTRIREAIQQGNLLEASNLLGRPYSILASVYRGSGKGTKLGYPTANISVEKLCLPPFGVYAVNVLYQECAYLGIANLGKAPTIHQERAPVLEVHLLDQPLDLYDQFIEVQFHTFLRPEKHFESIEALKAQIATDISQVPSIKALIDRLTSG